MKSDSPKLSVKSINSLVLVRALAISLVVANHSGIATGLHGGLNVLLVVSGISMATFAFKESTSHTLRAFRLFTLRIVVPSFIIALTWGIAVSNINLPELMFIRNWIDKSRVVLFPIWYVQMLFQLMIAFSILFWILDLTPKLKNSPVRSTSIILILSISVSLVSYAFWDTSHLHDKLPHLLAWNITFGWFVWAITIKNQKSLKSKLILSCTLVVCEMLTFIYTNAIFGEARFVWLTLFGFILIWVDNIILPTMLARMLLLISQATFFIFLFHHYAFWATWRLGKLFGFGDFTNIPTIHLIVSLVIPVFTWAFVTAIIRAYKRMKYENRCHAI